MSEPQEDCQPSASPQAISPRPSSDEQLATDGETPPLSCERSGGEPGIESDHTEKVPGELGPVEHVTGGSTGATSEDEQVGVRSPPSGSCVLSEDQQDSVLADNTAEEPLEQGKEGNRCSGVDEEGLELLGRARALCQAAQQLSNDLAPVTTRSSSSKRSTSTASASADPNSTSNHTSKRRDRRKGPDICGEFVDVNSTVAVIHGSSLVTCPTDPRNVLKRGDRVRLDGHEYRLVLSREPSKSSFQLTRDYRGETSMDVKLEKFKRQATVKASPPEDKRTAAEVIRDLFPDGSLPQLPGSSVSRSSLAARKQQVKKPTHARHHRRSKSTSSLSTIPQDLDGLGPIMEEPERPLTEPVQPLGQRTSTPTKPQRRTKREHRRRHSHDYAAKTPWGVRKVEHEQEVLDPEEMRRREERALEGLRIAKDRIKTMQREKAAEATRVAEEEAQRALERMENEEKARKERHAAAARLTKMKTAQRRMAMDMAASYKTEQERRRAEHEQRAQEAATSQRKLREATRARLARQKELLQEQATHNENEYREKLERRRQQTQAVCKRFLRKPTAFDQPDDSSSLQQSKKSIDASSEDEGPETHGENLAFGPEHPVSGRDGSRLPNNQLEDDDNRSSADSREHEPSLPPPSLDAQIAKSSSSSGLLKPGWASAKENVEVADKAAKSKRRAVWKQAPVPLAPLEDYLSSVKTNVRSTKDNGSSLPALNGLDDGGYSGSDHDHVNGVAGGGGGALFLGSESDEGGSMPIPALSIDRVKTQRRTVEKARMRAEEFERDKRRAEEDLLREKKWLPLIV